MACVGVRGSKRAPFFDRRPMEARDGFVQLAGLSDGHEAKELVTCVNHPTDTECLLAKLGGSRAVSGHQETERRLVSSGDTFSLVSPWCETGRVLGKHVQVLP